MNKKNVLSLLESYRDERGVRHWNKSANTGNLKSFGIGLTKLRKLAKQVGKDHELAAQLWQTEYYDARVLALLIDDPKQISREQAERQVEQVALGHLAHVFSSCGAPLTKTPFVRELADDWMSSKDSLRRSCGFGLLHELSKASTKKAPEDDYFFACVELIEKRYENEKPAVLLAMGYALMGIGQRTVELNAAALKVAKKIGPIHFDPRGKCDPFNVVKHLTSDNAVKKLGIGKAG